MIDLHCHVLPGIDDGPTTLDEAVALARMASEDGVTTIAATPHVDAGHPHNTARAIGARLAELQPHVALTLVPGGELDALHALELPDEELDALKLNRGAYLLFECPLSPVKAPAFAPAARALARRGHQLLLAHPERSPVFLTDAALLGELVDEGMLTQVTAGAFGGRFGRRVKELANHLLEHKLVHVIASDGHSANRPPTMTPDLHELDPGLVRHLTHDVPRAILDGEPPPAPPERPKPRRRRLFRP